MLEKVYEYAESVDYWVTNVILMNSIAWKSIYILLWINIWIFE